MGIEKWLGQRIRFGKDGREGTVVGKRDAIDFGALHNGSRRGVPPALRIVPKGEEDLEPVEVHPSRVKEWVESYEDGTREAWENKD